MRRAIGAGMTRWLIALAVTALAFSWAGAAPAGDPEVPEKYMSVDEVKKLLDEKRRVVFVDVRSREQFDERHIRGARNVPLTDLPKRLAEIPRGDLVVLY
jgi:3-mercaptopyruvate sulfurtransferase SseA